MSVSLVKYAFLLLLALVINQSLAQEVIKLPSQPKSFVVDSQDNLIAHLYGGIIVKITPTGKMTYVSEDIQKGFNRAPYPKCEAMAIDKNDNIYITDGSIIWKMSLDGKIAHYAGIPFDYTVKDGTLKTAKFGSIEFMKADGDGNIYVGERDASNKDNLGDFYLIRKISAAGDVTTILNTRENPQFKSNWIAGIAIDMDQNVYLSDGAGRCIKRLSPDGKVTVMAGLCGKRQFHPFYITGDISKAELMSPEDIVIDKKGEIIFSDGRLHRIIKIADKKVTTIAGNGVIQPNNVNMGGRAKEGYKDGPALTALFNFPLGCALTIDSNQNIYVIDGGNDCIRKLTPAGIVSTVAKR
ncbi:hypothetical protein [Dyadobacter sp. CY312]|uniref:NHL domain-containing protein n=1 Tax=Dyadobacter sp. CY312 TaxID=2907303 RepID=UPI001F3330DE|nr:hypothetical protein [Dyadobacter sp. CY312]MCE7039021.1 hypothetical protein [Dyadobacter sp. CY312]